METGRRKDWTVHWGSFGLDEGKSTGVNHDRLLAATVRTQACKKRRVAAQGQKLRRATGDSGLHDSVSKDCASLVATVRTLVDSRALGWIFPRVLGVASTVDHA
jgi:hypothetical protein